MAVTVDDLITKVPHIGTRDRNVLQFHLDGAIALIPESVEDGPARDLAITDLVLLSLSPTNVTSDPTGGLTYRDKFYQQNRIIHRLTGATILTAGAQDG